MSQTIPSRVRRWLRRPALHFSLLGIALYLGEAWIGATAGAGDALRVLTVGASRIEQLRGQWQIRTGRLPGASEEAWLIRQWVEDEMLYREALALGLDRDDPGVCYRLALNMSFLTASPRGERNRTWAPGELQELCRQGRELELHRGDPVIRRQMAEMVRLAWKNAPALVSGAPEPISRQELLEYLERHRERFSEPARLRLSHVFLSRDRRGDTLEQSAMELLPRLVASGSGEPDPRSARSLGDPFLRGPHPELSSPRDLERVFGSAFSRAVMDLPEGRWAGPVESGYGLHLVWVHERRPARLRPLEEVERQAVLGLRAERAEQRMAHALERLRARWEVRIERSSDVSQDPA